MIKATTWHILHDQQSKPVTKIIVSSAFHLHVFAHKVETKILDTHDFLNHAFFRTVCISTIRCISLIEQSCQKHNLIVERKAGNSPAVIHDGKLAHAKITADKIIFRLYIQIVQKRIIQCPWMHILNRCSISLIIGNARMDNMTIAGNRDQCLIKIPR